MAFRYGNFLTTALAAGETIADDATTIEIDADNRAAFSELVADDNEAILVIKEEVGGQTNFEIVKATSMSGNNLEVVRAQEGTTALEFTSAAQITSTVTAERAAIIGGTANIDIMPDVDDSKKLGDTGKAFSEVHTKELGVKADSQEYVIKKPVTVSATADKIDILLPKDTGTLARLEDSVEAHPGCFSGALCVEPAAEEIENAVARGNSEIGDGIHIVAYYDDEGQRKLKLAKHNDGGGTLVSLLGMELVPGTGGEDEPDAQYRRQTITVDGNEYNYLNAEYKTVGEYETIEGDIPTAFTQELVGTWLENITYTRQPPGLLVANSIYGQDISAEEVAASEAEIGEVEISEANVTGKLKIPVVTDSPGNDDDTTEGYEKGHVLFATATSTAYVCISETEGKAQWRPMSRLPNDALTRIVLRGRGTVSGGTPSNGSNLIVNVSGLQNYKRFYIDCEFGYLNQSSSGAVISDISSQVVDYEQFKDGTSLYAQNGRVSISYVSDTQVRINLNTGGTNPTETVALWGEA